MSFCFPQNTLLPYESLWSIVQKITHWNVCDVKDIQSGFHINPELKGGWYIATLLRKPRWNLSKVAKNIHVKPHDIQNGIIGTILCRNEISQWSSQTIRYCPCCIKIGYHSIIHQLTIFSTCPYHMVELKESCPSCGAIIDPGLNYQAILTCYGCQRCKDVFFDFSQGVRSNLNHLSKVFKEIGDLLSRRKHSLLSSTSLRGFDCTRSNLAEQLWLFWNAVYGNAKVNGIKIDFFEKVNLSDKSKFDQKGAYLKYLSHIEGAYIKDHMKCVQALFTKGDALGSLYTDELEVICDAAYAYIVWRLYWESGGFFPHIGSLRTLSFNEALIEPRVIEYRTSLTDDVARLIFKYECDTIWLSAWTYAQSMTENSSFNLPGNRLPLSVTSYWEVSESHNGENHILARLQLPDISNICHPFDDVHLKRIIGSISKFQEDKIEQVRKLLSR